MDEDTMKTADPITSEQVESNQKYTSERKRKAKYHGVAWIAIICLLLICLAGLAGGYIATRIFPTSANAANSSTASKTDQTTATLPELAGELNIAEIASFAVPSVVAITTESLVTSQNVQQFVTSGAGSGVIHSADGFIITNNHVVAGSQKFTVTLYTGQSYPAKLVGVDPQTDIAVLKITASGLKPAVVGDSSKMIVGEQVDAIGNPLGELGGTVTNGIISALDRPITLDNETKNLLQTNAAINPGNSGGGLFDGSGRLIGIVEAKSSGLGIEGIGFAIPINNVKSVIDELINYGYVRGRIDLGMTMIDIDSQQMVNFYNVPQIGVYVVDVISSGSADKAGLVTADCILSIDGTKVMTGGGINSIVEKHKVGDQLSILALRKSKHVTLTMILQEEKPISAK